MEERAFEIFKKAGVLLTGHFRLSSGRHSDKYMQCAKVFQHTEYSGELCAALADMFRGCGVQVVAGPAIGAIQMAYEVSRHLGCRNIFAERENGAMTLRRGFSVEAGERVLVVEDTVTTGGSVKEVIALLHGLGAEIIGVGALVDRSGGLAEFGCPFKAVAKVDITSWEEEKCPLCARGEPIVKPGSRV